MAGSTYGDYPKEIQLKIKERVEKCNNKFSKTTKSGCGSNKDGFTWEDSLEGYDFWYGVINDHNYGLFYSMYPKQKETIIPKFNISNHELRNKTIVYKAKMIDKNKVFILKVKDGKGEFREF